MAMGTEEARPAAAARGMGRLGLLAAAGATAVVVGAGNTALHYRRWSARMSRRRAAYDYLAPAPARPCGPLHARVAGPLRSPVLLLHGLAASSRSWGAGYDVLAERHRLVVPDMLGFGASARLVDGHGLFAQADSIAATLEAAGAGSEPVVVAAHSYGACVALGLAHRHPGLVRAIVAISPPVYPDAVRARECMLRALTPLERVIAMDTVWARRACTLLCMGHPRLAAWLARTLRPELPAEVAADAVAHTWTSYSVNLAELLGATARAEWVLELGLRFAVLTGDLDLLPDTDYLSALAARSPLVTLEMASDADHLPLMSHRTRVLELVEELAA